MQKTLLSMAVCTVLFTGQSAFAATPGGYVGVSGGSSKFKDVSSAATLDAQNAADGFTTTSTVDDTDTGWKIFGGYRFNPNLAIEGSYRDMGSATAHSVVSASPLGTGTVSQSFDAKTWELSAVGILPVTTDFDLFGKAGLHYWDAKYSVVSTLTGFPGAGSQSANGTDLMYGVGVGFNVTQEIALRAEWEVLTNVGDKNKTGQTDVEMWSGGVQYNF